MAITRYFMIGVNIPELISFFTLFTEALCFTFAVFLDIIDGLLESTFNGKVSLIVSASCC